MDKFRNWENLRYYLAVARQGTATAAARSLGVSNATVLRRIEQIESELGTRLFKKLQTGYELTPAGENLLDSASALERNINDIVMRFQGRDAELEGRLRISQPESDTLNLYPLYAEFSRRYPQITLEVQSSNRVVNLNRQEVDVAFRVIDSPPELLVGRCIGSVHFMMYSSYDYLSQFDNIDDLSQFDWVLWDKSEGGLQTRWLNKYVKGARIVLHASGQTDVLSAMRAGMGVGFISQQIAIHYPDLQLIPHPRSIATFKVWMLTHRDLRDNARVRVFMRFMAEAFKEQVAEMKEYRDAAPSPFGNRSGR